MKLHSEPMLIFRLACILMIFSVNPACAKELTFNTTWIDNSGEHKLVMAKEVNKDNTGEHLSVKQVTKGRMIGF